MFLVCVFDLFLMLVKTTMTVYSLLLLLNGVYIECKRVRNPGHIQHSGSSSRVSRAPCGSCGGMFM